MSLGLSESRRQRQKRRRLALIRWVFALLLLGALGLFAYETGAQLARLDVQQLENQVEGLESELESARERQVALESELGNARRRLQDMERRYQADVPDDDEAQLLEALRARLNEGLSAERLSFVVANATSGEVCEGDPVTRRFIVRTPLAGAGANTVSFAGGTITVTGEGAAAQSESGNPQAWFDPAQPIRLSFMEPGGESSEISGVLPLQHAIVAGGDEHRFTVVAGERAFVQVTWQRCDYP